MSNYRNRRNYENLERRIFDGVGEYGIPEIQPTSYEGGSDEGEWVINNDDYRRKGAKIIYKIK